MYADRRKEIDGIDVVLTYFSKGGERVRVPHTAVLAEARGPRGLWITVHEAGVLSGIARKIGMQDVATGSRAFDKRFIVKSNQPEAARVWLHAHTRKRMAQVQRYRYELRDGKVRAERTGVEDDGDGQLRIMRAVASLADGRTAIARRWKQALKKLELGRVRTRVNAWPRMMAEHNGHRVVVKVRTRGDHITTLIEADRTGSAGDVDVDDAELDRLDAYVDVRDDSIVVWMEGICDSPTRLVACVELAVGASRSARGPYR